mmetsp:Transcript_10299/g.27450  ORF Transcript_10299/g.27450 Transcript_10299/m.27450 type:complete len:395 (-) Transcript_10299:368-1552(-)
MCITAEYPAVMIERCSRSINRTSMTEAIGTRSDGEHATNPGLTSSSSTPFTRSRTLSPGSARDFSASSKWIPSTVNSCLFGMSTRRSPTDITPASSLPMTMRPPISLYRSNTGSFTGALKSRSGGLRWSSVSITDSPSYHEHTDDGTLSLRFIPVKPEAGIQHTSPCFQPTPFRNGHNFNTHSSYRSFDQVWSALIMDGSSILLIMMTSCRTPDVFANIACSRVCPPRSKPVSNSPFRAEMTSIPTSACDAPPIMCGTKLLCPGASKITNLRVSVIKLARPHSSVLPFSRSLSVRSSAQAYFQLSRFFAFASRSNFSIVRSSTFPVKYSKCPEIVLFPASTCPINTRFTVFRPSSLNSATARDATLSSPSAAASLSPLSASSAGTFSSAVFALS